MNAPALCRPQSIRRPQYVLRAGPGEAGDDRRVIALPDAFGDRLDAFEIARRGDRETSLQHVHAQLRQRLGHADFFVKVHRKTWRLLAVTQRGIENDNAVVVQRAEAGVGDAHRLGSSIFDTTSASGDPLSEAGVQQPGEALRGG